MSSVEIKGGASLYLFLKGWQPELEKQLRKEVTSLLKPIVKKSRSYIPTSSPLTNWAENPNATRVFPEFNATTARRGITYKSSPSKPNAKGFSYAAQIMNKSAVGAIFETAGRKNPFGQPWNPKSGSKDFSHSFNPNAGRMFVQAMQKESPLKGKQDKRGRAIFRAWEEDGGKTNAAVIRAIENTHNIVRNRFKKAA